MTEKRLLYVNLGSVITFVLFLFLSFVTAETESTHRVMIIICEITGGITFIFAIISLFYIRSDHRYMSVAILAFLSPWLIYALGYEMKLSSDTSYIWTWFISLYLLITAGIVLLRYCYRKVENGLKLAPVFLLFFHAIFIVYLIFIHIWWSLPFIGS
ncbi:hypothetical protein [Halobacillus litoralis]|uniref:hypothetical protein n=1 Tax=Halobacillus litoralis TaxID=45668 RepID=UPI001CFC81D2|nr:hypothetical protein [Halobacillus litoralis]